MSEELSEVYRTVEGNIGARTKNLQYVAKAELSTLKTTFNDAMALRPVAAVVDLIVGTTENIGNLVKTQASITRQGTHRA